MAEVGLETQVRQLQTALESRVVIEQAKGILAGRHDVTLVTAFDALRRGARSNHVLLHDLATRVVTERRTPGEIEL